VNELRNSNLEFGIGSTVGIKRFYCNAAMAHSCESYFMKLGFMKLTKDTENATMVMFVSRETLSVLCEPSSSAA